MPAYEYRVVPAPNRGVKARGVKGAEARFSYALQELMNQMGASGWEYQRAETLPSIERSGLTSTTTEWRNVLVFRRARTADLDAFAPELLPAPAAPAPRDVPQDTPAAEQPDVVEPAFADADAPQNEAEASPRETVELSTDDATKAEDTVDPTPDTTADEEQPDPGQDRAGGRGAVQMLRDNGVEELSDVAGVTQSLKHLAESRKSKKPAD